MRRLFLLALLAALALPGTAQAARVKIGPRASAVSEAGVSTIKVTNPNRYALRGSATVTVGKRTVATRTVRLSKKSVTTVALRFDRKAMDALRAAQGRATISLRLRRPGGGRSTARRTLTLRVGSGSPQGPAPPAPAPPAGGDTGSSNGGPPAPPGPTRWAGRLGTEGAYDDLELTVTGTQMEITKRPLVTVLCLELGGSYGSALSFEVFDAPGPWTLGTDGEVAKPGLVVNSLVGSGERTVTYKVTETAQQAGRITGKLGMSFSGSRFDFFDGTITFISCSGSPSFEAVPTG
jgi:hypothetical protein